MEIFVYLLRGDLVVDINWHNRGYSQTGRFQYVVFGGGITSEVIYVQHVKLAYHYRNSGVVDTEEFGPFGIPQNQGVAYTTGNYFKIYFYYVDNSFILEFEVPSQDTYNTSNRYCIMEIDYTYNNNVSRSDSFGIYITDTWGPTVYYIRQNETPRASQESVTTVSITTPLSGNAEIHDWGDYYYLIYKFSTYRDTYTLDTYLYNLVYSGYNLVGFTQGYYDSSLVPPWYITSSEINLLPNGTLTLPYNSQSGFGAVWRENTCPAIYEVYSNQWVPALSIAVNDGGTWKTPKVIYTYIEGRGWVQAPPSG